MKKTLQFLDYVASHLDAILTYSTSDIVLNAHSNPSHLSKPTAKRRTSGHYFVSNNKKDPADNRAVLNIAQLTKAVMSSAVEAEIGAFFLKL